MGSKLEGLLLVLLLIILKETGSTADCRSSCRLSACRCTDMGLRTVPQDLPTSIGRLYLRQNMIMTISPHAFLRYRSLCVIYLSSNRITCVYPHTFSNLTQLRTLKLDKNKITNIDPGVFSNLPQLHRLDMSSNQIKTLHPATFSNLPQLAYLWLENNQITHIQAGTFANMPQLRFLRLNNNQMVTLPSTAYDELSAIPILRISNNPWQCDCRMRPFRLKMTGSGSFENQMICSQPDNLQGQKLKDIEPEDLKCKEPTIVSFQRGHENTLAGELTLRLVCQVSGTPSPDVTVTLPSGLNVTVESRGRVTVQVNGTTSTITITNATSADSGLYICTAANHVGSAFATLSVGVQLNTATANTKAPPLAGNTSTSTHPTNSSYLAPFPTFSLPVPVGPTPSEDSNPDQSHTPTANTKAPPLSGTTSTLTHPTNSSYPASSSPTFSLPVGSTPSEDSNPTLIATIAGAVVGTVLIIGIILLTVCCWKRWTRNRSIGPDPGVVGFNNRDTTATITTSGHG
ncbi:uncharacterized protein LOC144917054 [Branchiostoma floridae x Branchiostoma belcheri]